jgi:regulator of sigma E protease
MHIFFGVLIGIIVLTVVVTAHEFGHFITAKRNGVTVKEFGIGFPPKAVAWIHLPRKEVEKYCKKYKFDDVKTDNILKKVKNHPNKKWFWVHLPKDEWYEETDEGLVPRNHDYLIFSLNWLPIGGFCQMDGETNIDTRKGTFGAASLWSKTKILFAGVAMNWLFAFVVFTILALTGMPELIDNQWRVENDTFYDETSKIVIGEVFEGTPAEAAGLKKLDIIKSVSAEGKTNTITSTEALKNYDNEYAGKEVTFKIERDGEESDIKVKLNGKDDKYILGISMGQYGYNKYHATWSAPIVAAVNTVQFTGETFKGLGTLVANVFSGIASQFSSDNTVKEEGKAKIEAAGDSVSGPVGIIGVLFPAVAQTGITNILYLAAIISISLACMNVLPIPALDGGRWFLIILFEKILRRKLTPEIENKIVSRAFMVLLIIAAFITVLDVVKILR